MKKVTMILLLLCCSIVHAGYGFPEEFPMTDSTTEAKAPEFVPLETLAESDIPSGEGFTMQKSPLEAMWRSALVPGWGQLYVESYWKAPLFFGGAATLGTIAVWNNSRFSDATAEYDAARAIGEPTAVLAQKKEFYRDQRDQAGFYLLAVIVLSVVDAFVGAHLFDMPAPTPQTADAYLQSTVAQQQRLAVRIRW